MKNVTVALDDDVYDRLATEAAGMNTSVSSLLARLAVNRQKVGRVSGEEFERLRQDELRLREQLVDISVGDNIPRDELYRRR